MNTTAFMTAVGELCTALDAAAGVLDCAMREDVISIRAVVNQPAYPDDPTPADVRRALYDGAERAIAIAEQTCTHDHCPMIDVSGESYPMAYVHLTLRFKDVRAGSVGPFRPTST